MYFPQVLQLTLKHIVKGVGKALDLSWQSTWWFCLSYFMSKVAEGGSVQLLIPEVLNVR